MAMPLSLKRLGWKKRRNAKLPLYRPLGLKMPAKECISDTHESQSDESDATITEYSTTSPPSSRSSRNISTSTSSKPPLCARKPRFHVLRRRPTRRHFIRCVNKIVRYLCLGMMAAILMFMYGLIRASQLENKKVTEGLIKRPAAIRPYPWESFEFLTRYYGGMRTLKPLAQNKAQWPQLDLDEPELYNETKSQQQAPSTRGSEPKLPPSESFARLYPGSATKELEAKVEECFLDENNTVRVPAIRYYNGRPDGFPHNILGSYALFGLPQDICYERHGRYGPYGYGYSIRSGGLGVGQQGDMTASEETWQDVPKVQWRGTDWAEVQRRCYQKNTKRYKPTTARHARPRGLSMETHTEQSLRAGHEVLETAKREATTESQFQTAADTPTGPTEGGVATEGAAVDALPRTAVVIRCWDQYRWREDDMMNLRSLISELSLASGARYDVHLLVQVKDDARDPIWADDQVYHAVIKDRVPDEFHGLVTLWTETQMLSIYQGLVDLWARGPDLPVHGSYRGLQMAMQYFAYNHAEYDYFWQWEMDIRYIGHHYDLFAKLEDWGRKQPRKGLWERNARFYVPVAHGTWDDFKHMARLQTESGTAGADNVWQNLGGAANAPSQLRRGEQTVWGPERPVDEQDWWETETDPVPPTTYERDSYVWGVGEEADLITLNPIFDPDGTTWGLADDITGYNETDGIGKPPRRAQIITASRMSRRLLLTMHRETAFMKHHAFPEMWPATAALHHGYKAVFAPHPVYVDRAWPPEYMARIFNGGRNGAAGGSRTSVFGHGEHNLQGLTWLYNSGFAGNLYRRWLGQPVNNDGGEEFETQTDMSLDDATVSTMRGGEGRMCLPPMLIHPVKEVELPVEREVFQEEILAAELEVMDPAS